MTTMTTATDPWWRTFPNPPCESWCTTTHPPDEFGQYAGGLECCHSILTFGELRVDVTRHKAAADEPGLVVPQDTCVSLTDLTLEELTAEQAELLGAALLAAAAFAKAVSA